MLHKLQKKPHLSERVMGQWFTTHCQVTYLAGCYYLTIASASKLTKHVRLETVWLVEGSPACSPRRYS